MVGPQVSLTPIPPTPVAWRNANLFHLLAPIVVAAALLVFIPWVTIPVAVVGLILVLIALRRRELTDPIVENPYDPAWVARLRLCEDHDVTNQYTAMGSIKPGRFRLGLELVILYVINWAARHVFTRGGLGRIGTIHFAHWVLIDDRRRAFFCSNYDGGHEAYMDDFINKAGFGLNLSFSSAIAYPQTDWLIKKGAWREMDFKRFQRRHQIPTDVWYKAYPGLTARDLARNARIRNGFEKPAMSDDEIRRWLCGNLRAAHDPPRRRPPRHSGLRLHRFRLADGRRLPPAAGRRRAGRAALSRRAQRRLRRGRLREAAATLAEATQCAVTAAGLRALGVAEAVVQRFDPEFVEGMAGDSEPLAAARRHRRECAGQVDMGRRRARTACGRHAVCRTGANRRPGARDARSGRSGAVSP